MITGKLANIASFILPMVYRKCPMGNVHLRTEILCECCPGNEFIWSDAKWVLLKYAPITHSQNHAALSWSGQLSSGELWLSAFKQGIIIAIGFGIIFSLMMWKTQAAFQHVSDSKKQSIEQQSND